MEWIPQRAWVYKCNFLTDPLLEGRRIFLHFEGVDYSARFFLNGEFLGFHEGMFTPVVFEVGDHLAYDDLIWATVAVQVELDSLIDQETDISFKLVAPNGDLFTKQDTAILASGINQLQAEMLIHQPLLWWPNGYGDQPLYQLEVEIGSSSPTGERLQSYRRLTFGIRKMEFIQNDGNRRNALPYTLVVNNRRLYIKGWNWVPMDVFYGLEQHEKLQRLIELARRANVNFLRVWGGAN